MACDLDRVSLKDWAMAAIGGAFTLAGLIILPRDFHVGIVTVALFGLCFAFAVHVILRKRRLRRQVAVTARVAGGVPIRPSRTRLAMLGAAFAGLGAILVAFGPAREVVMTAIAWGLLVLGVAMLGALAVGVLPRGHLLFDPSGITFADLRGTATVPWSAIVELGRGEIHSNQAVFLRVDPAAVTAEPPSHLPRVHKRMASSVAWVGAEFMIMSSAYGIDAPVLLAVLERYVMDPVAREELQPVGQLPV